MNLDILNSALLSDYSEEEYKLEDLKLISDLVKIILSVPLSLEVPIYKKPMSLETSLYHAKNFLEILNKEYKKDLENAINDGYVVFRVIEDFFELSSTLNDTSNKYIEYNMTGYVFDVYSIVHELIHYTSLDVKNKTINWRLTTEAYAFVAEALLAQYLKSIPYNIPEIELNDVSNIVGIIEKTMMLDFEIELMKKFMIKRKITHEDIVRILKNKNETYIEYAIFDIKNVCEKYNTDKIYELNFSNYQSYVIGYLLATHILNKINNDNSYINEYINLINNSNNMTFVETLKKLDLEVIDEENVILSDNSIKVLKREYKKRVEVL